MLEVEIGAVAALMSRRDRGDGPVDRLDGWLFQCDGDYAALRRGFRRVGLADFEMVNTAIYSIEDQIVAIGELVGEAACHHAADQWHSDLASIMTMISVAFPVDTRTGQALGAVS